MARPAMRCRRRSSPVRCAALRARCASASTRLGAGWLRVSSPAVSARSMAKTSVRRGRPSGRLRALAALATRALRRWSGARCLCVQILDPRIDPRHYDVVVAPRHDGLAGDNVITTTGSLNAIDDAWLAAARVRFSAIGALPAPRVAVLVGAPTRSQALDRRYFDALLAELGRLHARDGGSFLVTTSRHARRPRRASRQAFAAWPGLYWSNDADGDNRMRDYCLGGSRRGHAGFGQHVEQACATGVPCTASSTPRARPPRHCMPTLRARPPVALAGRACHRPLRGCRGWWRPCAGAGKPDRRRDHVAGDAGCGAPSRSPRPAATVRTAGRGIECFVAYAARGRASSLAASERPSRVFVAAASLSASASSAGPPVRQAGSAQRWRFRTGRGQRCACSSTSACSELCRRARQGSA